jgi:hypothetical protein
VRPVSLLVIFIESGTESAGLAHVIKEHGDQFLSKGISLDEIPEVLVRAATEGTIVGYQGNRPIYQYIYNGMDLKVAVSVGSNGYIVGANAR